MKKLIWKVIMFAVLNVAFATILSVAVDPFNVFHYNSIRNYGVEPNKNYIKTKYVIDNPAKFDGFLFGASRVGAIYVDKIKNCRLYNMTYPNGTPQEHLETLSTFL